MDELFKKVYIKTEADLPKKEGFYIMQYKNKSIGFMNWWEQDWRDWLKNINWYFQPIEEQECEPDDQELFNKIEQAVSDYLKAIGSVNRKDCIEYDFRQGISLGMSLRKPIKTK